MPQATRPPCGSCGVSISTCWKRPRLASTVRTKLFVDSTNDFVEATRIPQRRSFMSPAKSLPPRPTQAELEILNALWECGPSSVREVRQRLTQSRAFGYTTVLKLLQIMAGKGVGLRRQSGRFHVYRGGLARE